MIISREDANLIVLNAIDNLVTNDFGLLELNVSERALTFKLAHYISLSNLIVPPLSVDCEYNRHFSDPKIAYLKPRKSHDRELRATTIFPDILVHQRNSDEHNYLVLEIKKPGERIDYDQQKLEYFRDNFRYHHTAHLILGIEKKNLISNLIWVD